MLNGYEPLILIGIVLLVFGSSQIPKFAKNIGRAQREFKSGIAEGQAEGSDSDKDSSSNSTDSSSKNSATKDSGSSS